MIGHIIFIFTVAIGLACVSYEIMARNYGWPVGEVFAKTLSIPKLFGFFGAIYALIKSFLIFYWWTPFVVLVFAQFLAFGIVMVFKKNTQIVCIFGVFLGFIFTVLYTSESTPLGFLR